MTEERDFISRWSKRKAEAREGLAADDAETDVAALAPDAEAGAAAPQAGTEPVADPEEMEIPEELKGIDIDAMGYDADFTVFMKAGVPEALRRKALRRLWRSDPVLACLDGLNDYEEDFTDAAMAVKGLESAYRVGKGYLFAEEETIEPEADLVVDEAVDPVGEEPVSTGEDAEVASASDDPVAEEPTADEKTSEEVDTDGTGDLQVEVAATDDKSADPDVKA